MSGLPAGWHVARLDAVAEVRLGRQRSPKNHQGTSMKPYLRAANVTWQGIDLRDVKEMNFTDSEMTVYRLQAGDILLSEASGSAGEVGKPAIWREQIQEVAFQNTLLRVRPRDVLAEYLLHFLKFQALAGKFVQHSRGVGIHHLGRERLASWRVPVAPESEQQRIVDILEDHLSRLDAAGDYFDSALRRAGMLERAMLTSFVDQGRPRVPLARLVRRVEAGKSFGSSAPPAADGEWGIIKVSAMTWGEFRATENKRVAAGKVDARYEIRAGDLLVSRANTSEYVGASVVVRHTRPRLLLSDKSLRLVLAEGVDPEWVHACLSTPAARAEISRRATGTKESMRNISQTALLETSVPDVPESEREGLLARVRAGREATQALSWELTKQQRRGTALRRALLHAAFSGRLTGRSSDLDLAEELAAQ